MSTGLLASTVTPGRTAPDASFTTPAMLPVATPCASAVEPDASINTTPATSVNLNAFIVRLLLKRLIAPPFSWSPLLEWGRPAEPGRIDRDVRLHLGQQNRVLPIRP